MRRNDKALTSSEAAALAGVKPATWRRYTTPNASRGGKLFGPAPDGHADPCGCAYWYASTVRSWMLTRPSAQRGEGS